MGTCGQARQGGFPARGIPRRQFGWRRLANRQSPFSGHASRLFDWTSHMARGRRPNKTGRSKGLSPFLMLPNWVFDSPAYRSLRPVARALLLELIRRHNGSNNGAIGLGEREAASALGMRDRAAVRSYFDELAVKGFIACTWRGGFNVKSGPQRASEWRLTWEPTTNGMLATRDFMRWQPDAGEQISRDRFTAAPGQENYPAPVPKAPKCALPGQENYPANAHSEAAPGQESCPHIDMPWGGGPKRKAQRSHRHLNGSGHEGVDG